MRVAITGSTGLAKTIIDTLEATPYNGKQIDVMSERMENITVNGSTWWGWEQYDVLINFAYDDFEQTKILELNTMHGKMTTVNTLLTFLQEQVTKHI